MVLNRFLEPSLILVLLTMLMVLGSSRIVFCIRLLAIQGAALSFLPLVIHSDVGLSVWLLVSATCVIKGILLPWLLLRARRKADVHREVEPFIGFGASILMGVAMLAASFWITSKLPLPHHASSALAMSTSFFGLFCGLFLIISRRKAIMQVLGYLVLENGIFVFGIMFVRSQPLIVEMGVLLDLIVGVFVMGIAIFHISREFDHIDVDRLNKLKDVATAKDTVL